MIGGDALTGLPNRSRFHLDLASRLRACGTTRPVHLAVLDLDHFRSVNDAHGHGVGDRLLAAVARRLEDEGEDGSSVYCARVGANAFALVSALPGAPADWEGIRRRLEAPYDLQGTTITIGTSIGHATAPGDGATAPELLHAAELALRQAKHEGPSTIRRFDGELLDRSRRQFTVRNELVAAIERSELCVHLQPQVDAGTGHVVGFEALARWDHPRRGLLPPSEFIAAAEAVGLAVPLGEELFAQACRELRQLPPPLRMSVNLSGHQLSSPDLVARLSAIAEREGVTFERMELEVTESVAVDAAAAGVLQAFRCRGATVAIDDFGTGFSALAALRVLPVDTLKVDRSFVAPLDQDDRAAIAVVAAIVELSAALGLQTVGEGIETAAQWRTLRDLGCGTIQGYFESMPLAPAAVPAYLWSRRGRRAAPIEPSVGAPATPEAPARAAG